MLNPVESESFDPLFLQSLSPDLQGLLEHLDLVFQVSGHLTLDDQEGETASLDLNHHHFFDHLDRQEPECRLVELHDLVAAVFYQEAEYPGVALHLFGSVKNTFKQLF